MTVKFGKIDAYANQKMKDRFKVNNFPKLILYKKGQPVDYTGSIDSHLDFYSWIFKKIESSVKAVSTEAELKQEIKYHGIVVLYFGHNNTNDYIKVYEVIARRYDKAFFLRAE